MTTTLKAPAGRTGIVTGRNGSKYTIANGSVSVDDNDVVSLLGAGFGAFGGVFSLVAPYTSFRNADGTLLAAAASAGKFGLANTIGTSMRLAGEAAQNNTKTDAAFFEVVLPESYAAGGLLTVTISAKIAGTGTPGTKTIDVSAYEISALGAAGSDLCLTDAKAVTTSDADYAFQIAGGALVPGDRLTVQITGVLQETGNVATVNLQINSVKVAA